MKTVTLNNGMEMPVVGLGVFRLSPEEAEASVKFALENGYRSIDTANVYFNEKAVGRAIKASEVAREDIFLTSKIWPSDFKRKRVRPAVEATLARLGVDYLDCLVLHQAAGKYLEAYEVCEELVKEGKIRSIALSNFYGKHYDKVLAHCKIKPVFNTLECNPLCQQRKMKEILDKDGIFLESWYPLGGKGNTSIAGLELFQNLAKKYGKTPQQIILRWHIDRGYIIIPGSKSPKHLQQNLDLFDFSFTEEEMKQIEAIDQNKQRLAVVGWIRPFLPLFRANYNKQQ